MSAGHEMRIVLDVAGEANGDYGYRGYAGGFMRALCEAIFRADRVNRAKLWVVFPDLVDAVDHYETRPLDRSKWVAEADLREADNIRSAKSSVAGEGHEPHDSSLAAEPATGSEGSAVPSDPGSPGPSLDPLHPTGEGPA